LNIPINELPRRLNEIPRDKLVATFCSGGDRSNVAFAYLRVQGFDNVRILKATYPELTAELLPGKLRKTIQSKA
jgi:rhodanese-related sulfurtransferase